MRSFKIPVLWVIFLLCCVQHQLQSQPTFNAGVNTGAGNSGFLQGGKFGLGGSLEYVAMVGKKGGVRLYAGYDWFNQNQPKNIDPQVLRDSMQKYPYLFRDKSALPLRVGYQQFLFGNAAFVYGEAGMARLRPSDLNKKNVFTYALGTGYQIALREEHYVQLSFFYNQYLRKAIGRNGTKVPANSNYFNLRVAYGLYCGKKK